MTYNIILLVALLGMSFQYSQAQSDSAKYVKSLKLWEQQKKEHNNSYEWVYFKVSDLSRRRPNFFHD
ncbi:MAG: hypothetical protein GY810_12780 [Aureispira sp.]|nr:hypothetical protein [Aureispira sp.]